MPLLGPVPEGGTFFCPHCGALYSVSNIAKCVVFGQTMDEGDSFNEGSGLQAHSSA